MTDPRAQPTQGQAPSEYEPLAKVQCDSYGHVWGAVIGDPGEPGQRCNCGEKVWPEPLLIVPKDGPPVFAALPPAAPLEPPAKELVAFILDALESDATKEQHIQAFDMLRNWADLKAAPSSEGARLLREVAKLPSPLHGAFTPADPMAAAEWVLRCRWCEGRWTSLDGPLHIHPDNGCLWPRAQAAAAAPVQTGTPAEPPRGACDRFSPVGLDPFGVCICGFWRDAHSIQAILGRPTAAAPAEAAAPQTCLCENLPKHFYAPACPTHGHLVKDDALDAAPPRETPPYEFDDYAIALRRDPNDGAIVVWCPDLSGCMAHGYNLHEALTIFAEGKAQWMELARQAPRVIPPPSFGADKMDDYDAPASPGRWDLRLVMDRLKARIHGLVNHGTEICESFVPQSEVPVSCGRCGYTSEVHDIRDANRIIAALDAAAGTGE